MTTPTMPSDYPEELSGNVLGGGDAPAALLEALHAQHVPFSVGETERADHGRDWWPLSIGWVAKGEVPSFPGVVVFPRTVEDVQLVLRTANELRIAVTPQGGRSGVVGGAVPMPGAIALDLTHMNAVLALDAISGTVTAQAGIFGPDLEAFLGPRDLTTGHVPQSFDLSTLGGWLACRGAGQRSNRYGKIEDIVRGLSVVLANGDLVVTGNRGPRQAVGPDLNQLFVGSEGTLGVIVEATLVVRHIPDHHEQTAYQFSSFADGLEACRRIIQRGAHPSVLRLYDETETKRNFDVEECALIVLEEGDVGLVRASMSVVTEECSGATLLDPLLVDRWLAHRNDVSALAPLWARGIVVDTIEIAGSWANLATIHQHVVEALLAIPGIAVASVHQSHAYDDGACLYFTFAGYPEEDTTDFYRRAWDVASEVVLAAGGALSHHHGVGRNRARFVSEALGDAYGVLVAMKDILDPNHILNPGVLGLGAPPW